MNSSAKLVADYIEAVWNRADMKSLDTMTPESFTYQLGGQPPRGREDMKQFLELVHGAFPDWRVEIEQIVAEDNVVAARWTGNVTHKGDFHGIPATGRKIAVSGMNFYVIEDGRIAKEWEQMDSMGMLQQMGALPGAD